MAEKETSVEIAPSLHTNHPATPPSEEIIPQKSKQSLSDKFTIVSLLLLFTPSSLSARRSCMTIKRRMYKIETLHCFACIP